MDTIAWHAGESVWGDRRGLNKYSIGIELYNAGRLTKSGEQFISWFGRSYPEQKVIKAVHRNEKKPSYWHRFSEEQITKTYKICELLIDTYDIKTIIGHEEISPGRKSDPGPAFPLDKLLYRLLHADRSDQGEDEMAGVKNPGIVTASMLNIRSGPNTGMHTIAEPLKKGTLVDIRNEKDGWYQVDVKISGWVSKKFISKTTT